MLVDFWYFIVLMILYVIESICISLYFSSCKDNSALWFESEVIIWTNVPWAKKSFANSDHLGLAPWPGTVAYFETIAIRKTDHQV